MNRPPPLKRIDELIPLSHDHHHALWLSLKIRTGFKKGIDPFRIKKYTDWFYELHLVPHFDLEEKYVFPILGEHNELVKRALKEHRKLNRLFRSAKDIEKSLVQIEEKLESHIRFEERVLFEKIQQVAAPDELDRILAIHNSNFSDAKFEERWEDEFWK